MVSLMGNNAFARPCGVAKGSKEHDFSFYHVHETGM